MKSLREALDRLTPDGKSPVDRLRCVIRRVKIVGKVSRNGKRGRRYTDDCLKSARRLYEGLSVRCNHKKRRDQNEDRPVEDVLGHLRNVRYAPDGLYADLYYLKNHPMADRLCEAAERMPTAFGLSHNVDKWEGQYDAQGIYVVTEINKVESVDLVADPGSTRGLFESYRKGKPMKKSRVKLSAWVGKQQGPIQAAFKKLLESDMVSGGTMLASEEDPMAAVSGAFNTAMMSVLTNASTDSAIKLQKIGAILKSQDELVASGAFTPTETPTESEEPDESDDETASNSLDPDLPDDQADDPKKDEVVESLRKEVQALKRRDECRRLCESMGVTPSAVQLKAIERLDNDVERKAFLRESVAPKRTSGGPGSSGGSSSNPQNAKEFVRAIRKR